MGASAWSGPIFCWGNLTEILSAAGQGQSGSVLVPDPNSDRGPSVIFQGVATPDIRYTFGKDKVQGYTGMVPSHLDLAFWQSINQIPAALATNNIAAAQNVANNVAMTLAGASTGVALNVPISTFAGFGGFGSGAVVTAALALDFGFAFGTTVAASTSMAVADSTMFVPGMPLVIAGVGNVAGTACLLTNVISITDATHIVLADAPAKASAAAPIGTGNNWAPSENGIVTPTFAFPYLAGGPGLFFDPTQGLSRGLQISSADAAAAGGTFLVSGYDVYSMAMTELVTVAAGASTGFTKKSFKYIVSVTPKFTDAHAYVVGTSDVFGFCARSDQWELTNVYWNGAAMTTNQGWLAGVTTSPATNVTGDVRGTIQTGAGGGGTGIGANASNGSIVGLLMSGRRLVMMQSIGSFNALRGVLTDTRTIYGVTQA